MLPETRSQLRNVFEHGDNQALEALFATDPESESILNSHLDSALVRHAAVSGSVDFLQWLVARGADPNAVKDSDEIRAALLGYEVINYPPRTPLFEAVRRNRRDLVEALLHLSAHPALAIENPSAGEGNRVETLTPKLLAYRDGNDALVALLEARGAVEPIPLALRLLRLIETGIYREAFESYLSNPDAIDPTAMWYQDSPFDAALHRLHQEAERHIQGTILAPAVGAGETRPEGSTTEEEALDALVSLVVAFVEQAGLPSETSESRIAYIAVLLGDPSLLQLALRAESPAQNCIQSLQNMLMWGPQRLSTLPKTLDETARLVRDALEHGISVEAVRSLISPVGEPEQQPDNAGHMPPASYRVDGYGNSYVHRLIPPGASRGPNSSRASRSPGEYSRVHFD